MAYLMSLCTVMRVAGLGVGGMVAVALEVGVRVSLAVLSKDGYDRGTHDNDWRGI